MDTMYSYVLLGSALVGLLVLILQGLETGLDIRAKWSEWRKKK